jgi:hypothetical protein
MCELNPDGIFLSDPVLCVLWILSFWSRFGRLLIALEPQILAGDERLYSFNLVYLNHVPV